MSKTTRGNSVFSESNLTLISSNTNSSGISRRPRAPKDSILYSSTIKEDISEYDHEQSGDKSYLENSAITNKSEKKVKIVGEYKKTSPGKDLSTPKKPLSGMFKKKRESVRYGDEATTLEKRKVRNSTSVPKATSTRSFPNILPNRDTSKVKPRSSSGKKKEDDPPAVTLHFAGGAKLDSIPDIGKIESVLNKMAQVPLQLDDNTRSTILDIRTATFYYLFALANKFKDDILSGGQLKSIIKIDNYNYLRDSNTVKSILKYFNLCKFAKIERGAARASKDGNRASWVKIDYSWKLENPRYWPTILLKIAAFLKGSPIKQTSFNQKYSFFLIFKLVK